MTIKDVDTLFCHAFATGSVPFYFIENPYFRRAIELLGAGQYNLLHHTTLRDKVLVEAQRCSDLVKRLVQVCV
jgi:hypothetical protein